MSTKTRFLNKLRRVFLNPSMEKFLRGKVSDRPIDHFWSKLVPNKYQYAKGSLRHFNYRGIKLSADLSDYIGHYLYFGFKDSGQDKLLSLAKEGDHVLDIGTNIGSTALLIAQKVGSEGKVLGFEPDPVNFKSCMNNLSLNDLQHLEVFNLALGDENSSLNLVVDSESNRGGNRISFDESKEGEKVEVKKLDDLMQKMKWEDVDLVKIDVEGYELKVLKGGVETFRKHKPTLFIELDDDNLRKVGDSARSLILYLNELGYNEIYHAIDDKVVNPEYSFDGLHFDIIATHAE